MENKTDNKTASVQGINLPVSLKHSKAICKFIRNKKIGEAIAMLELVAKTKKAVPIRGQLPHRKGMCSGRYPVKASLIFIKLLKSLASNAMNKKIENPSIIEAYVNKGTTTMHHGRHRGKFKRTHVAIKAAESLGKKTQEKEKSKSEEKKEQKAENKGEQK